MRPGGTQRLARESGLAALDTRAGAEQCLRRVTTGLRYPAPSRRARLRAARPFRARPTGFPVSGLARTPGSSSGREGAVSRELGDDARGQWHVHSFGEERMRDDALLPEDVGDAVFWRAMRTARRRELAGLVDSLHSGTLSRREFFQRAAGLGISLVAAQSLPGAFAPRAVAAVPQRGGVLKAAFSADPAGFDPVRGPSGMSHVVIEQ